MTSNFTWLDVTIMMAVGAVLIYCVISIISKVIARPFKKY